MTWCTVVCWTLYSYIHICIIVYDLQWSPIPYTIYILNKKLITYFLLSICCSSIQFPSPKKKKKFPDIPSWYFIFYYLLLWVSGRYWKKLPFPSRKLTGCRDLNLWIQSCYVLCTVCRPWKEPRWVRSGSGSVAHWTPTPSSARSPRCEYIIH